ncbi:unnamed protein product [Camellia sinensis]
MTRSPIFATTLSEKVSTQGITFQDEWPYSIHLLGHIYIDDMSEKSTGINYGCKSIPKKKLICKSIPKKKFINHTGIQYSAKLLDMGVLFSAVRVLKKRLLAMLKTEHVPPVFEELAVELVFGSSFTFKPDLAKFNMTRLEDDVVALMKNGVIDLARCLGKIVKVELNGKRIPVKSFLDYVNLYLQSASKARPDALPRAAVNRIISLTESTIASGDDEGCIKVWDTRQRTCCNSFDVHEEYISNMTLAFDSIRLLGTRNVMLVGCS